MKLYMAEITNDDWNDVWKYLTRIEMTRTAAFLLASESSAKIL